MTTDQFVLTDQERIEVRKPYFIKDRELEIRFLIGKPQDFDVLLDYYEEVAFKLKPVDIASKFSQVEYREYYKDLIERWLSNPFTIMAVDSRDNSVCGLITGTIESTKNQKKRPLKFDKDYGKKVAECEGPNMPVKTTKTFFGEIQSFMPNFFPEDCVEFLRVAGLVVSPEYQGAGIASILWEELLKLAVDADFEHITATSTSPMSVNIAKKFGMRPVFTYKYGDFLCDGVQILGHTLIDGSTELKLMIGNLKEMKRFYG